MIDFLPEWIAADAILMAFPDPTTDWNYILEEAEDQYRRLVEAFTGAGERVVMLCKNTVRTAELLGGATQEKLLILEAEYNDTWTRDYGPLTVRKHGDLRLLDFGFNGWGLKFAADRDNLVNINLAKRFVLVPEIYRNNRDFTLEGGSVDTDGEGTVLTTSRCLCSPNRNGGLTKRKAQEELSRRLGAQHILWLDYGALEGDDTDSHIDTLARLAPGDTIIFTGCRDAGDPHFEQLLRMRAQLTMFRNAAGNPFNLVELPLPDPVTDPDGERLPATYANYLVTDRNIFVPTYSQPAKDSLAAQTLAVVFPSHNVVQVDCRTLLRQHGSLHCATMQLPAGTLNPAIYER